MIAFLSLLVSLSTYAAETPTGAYDPKPFPLVDEAPLDPSFLEFRKKFVRAVERRDSAFLIASLAPNIAFSFGGHGDGDGPDGFRSMWALGRRGGKSKLWPLLKRVLYQGGKFNDDHSSFTAPYASAAWPNGVDTFDYIAVIDRDVPAHQLPSPKSPELQKISYEIVRIVAGRKDDPKSWAAIILPSGQRGFVQNKHLQPPIGYRARFEKTDKGWKLATFIIGN